MGLKCFEHFTNWVFLSIFVTILHLIYLFLHYHCYGVLYLYGVKVDLKFHLQKGFCMFRLFQEYVKVWFLALPLPLSLRGFFVRSMILC